MLFAYSMTQRGEKTYWNKIGVAFKNRDGSITVKLDSLPVSGELQVREDNDRRDDRRGPPAGDDTSEPWA